MAFDYLLIAIVCVSMVFGLLRGFVREALSLASWIAAVWLAWAFAPGLAPLFGFDSPLARLWLARVLIFLGVVTVGALAGQFVATLVRRSTLSGTDRGLGALFGLARGALLLAVVVVAARTLEAPGAQWWTQSKIAPYGLAVAAWVAEVLDAEMPPADDRGAARAQVQSRPRAVSRSPERFLPALPRRGLVPGADRVAYEINSRHVRNRRHRRPGSSRARTV